MGLALSLVCLLLCILTFLLVRPIQGSRTTVHLHLCICLFLGSAIFLAGIENEGGQVRSLPTECPSLTWELAPPLHRLEHHLATPLPAHNPAPEVTPPTTSAPAGMR